jgi:hypothetical protein
MNLNATHGAAGPAVPASDGCSSTPTLIAGAYVGSPWPVEGGRQFDESMAPVSPEFDTDRVVAAHRHSGGPTEPHT